MNQPKYWNSIFAIAVKQAYDSKKLTENNIEEWETEYNNGVKPIPSLGTKEILDYYIQTEYKEVQAKLKTLYSKMNGSEQYAVNDAISNIQNDNADTKDTNIIESYARKSCHMVDNGNAEPEYEDEDFYEEEVDPRAVINYLMTKYHLER